MGEDINGKQSKRPLLVFCCLLFLSAIGTFFFISTWMSENSTFEMQAMTKEKTCADFRRSIKGDRLLIAKRIVGEYASTFEGLLLEQVEGLLGNDFSIGPPLEPVGAEKIKCYMYYFLNDPNCCILKIYFSNDDPRTGRVSTMSIR